MKSANDIINHLKLLPQFKKLHEYDCYIKFTNLIHPRIKQSILFMYRKEKTLFIALNNQGILMEANSNIRDIKKILNQFVIIKHECNLIDDVKFFLSKKVTQIDTSVTNSNPIYKELATGEFVIKTSKTEFKDIFEEIKDIICSRES